VELTGQRYSISKASTCVSNPPTRFKRRARSAPGDLVVNAEGRDPESLQLVV